MFNAPIALCETASVFGEMVTFRALREKLLREGNQQAYLSLLLGKIDDLINTAVRQIQFSEFERRVHGAGRWLTGGEFDDAWVETRALFYGPNGEVFFYGDDDHLWAYVPHFHRPFYMYAYSFGELVVHGLWVVAENFGDKFESMYLDALRAGGTKDAAELFRPFGLDLGDADFWKRGIDAGLRSMIEEAEALARDLRLV